MIKLPEFKSEIKITTQIVAFSCDPTSPTCVVFTVNSVCPTYIAASTWRSGVTEWFTTVHRLFLPFESNFWNKMIFSNDKFYCLSQNRRIGVFDPKDRTFKVFMCRVPISPENYWKRMFLAEHDGDILAMYTGCTDYPIIFKLDQQEMIWEEVKTLGGISLFVSFLSSYSRADLPGIMRDNVYFKKVRFYGRRCVSYSLQDSKYHPSNEFHDWEEQYPVKSIWIDPPQDLSVFK